MLTSAPFDDWWHSAYGLDVKILSPPHVVLVLGVFAIEAGALILILGYRNRASGPLRNSLDRLFLYMGAMIARQRRSLRPRRRRRHAHQGHGFRARRSALSARACAKLNSMPVFWRRHPTGVALGSSAFAATGVLIAVFGGNKWWTGEAGAYSRNIYKPLAATSTLAGDLLTLRLANTVVGEPSRGRFVNFLGERKVDDFLPGHGHLMHLYVIRWPAMDRVWRLHPSMTSSGVFERHLAAMPAGTYRLFGDVVHATGFPETITSSVDTAGLRGTPLIGDDAGGTAPPVAAPVKDRTVADLDAGWKMVWDRNPGPLTARRATLFRFHIETPDGKRAHDLELYMGMPGHAAFIATGGSVFAHVHPSGSVAMAALELANPSAHNMMNMAAPTEVVFPYGFPQPGAYRIIVQMKRAGAVQTGTFDAHVSPP